MVMLTWNALLALVWAALTGSTTPANLVFGFLLGFLALFAAGGDRHRRYVQAVRRLFGLLAYFIAEILLANFRVAYDVATPTPYMRPGIIAVPLDVRTDAEITLLANMISLTPGSLSLDVSADRRVLYVHVMYLEEGEQTLRRIKEGFEKRILEVFE